MEQVILAAAERLFLEKGFALTSTTEIAREAGCNQALVHYYFRTKENLFRQIFEMKVRVNAPIFLKLDDLGGTFQEKLARKIEAHFEVIGENPKLPLLIINEVTTNPQRLEAIKESIHELPQAVIRSIEQELRAEIAAGRVREISIVDLMLNIMSLNISLFLLWPVFQSITQYSDAEYEEMLRQRKKEHVRVILKSLEP